MEQMAGKKPQTGSEIRKANSSATGLNERPRGSATRVYTPEFKHRILREIDQLAASGEYGAVGAFIRREGLQWSTVHRWQKLRDGGEIAALAAKPRGRKSTRDASAEEIERLQKQVAKLETNLRKAEIIIDVQKNSPRCWVWLCRTPTRRSHDGRSCRARSPRRHPRSVCCSRSEPSRVLS